MQTEVMPGLYDELAERSLLSAFMLDGNLVEDAGLKSDDFFFLKHQHVFAALHTLSINNKPTDNISVGVELERMGRLEEIGGHSWVAELSCEIPSTASARHYMDIVKEFSRLRGLGILAKGILQQTQDSVPSEKILTEVDQTIQTVYAAQSGTSWLPIQQCVQITLDQVERAHQEESPDGWPSGLKALDERIQGFHRGNLIIEAGRPSMGKTSLALVHTLAAAKVGAKIGIISLEMSHPELVKRLLAIEGQDITVHRLDRGPTSTDGWPALVTASEALSSQDIYICDEGTVTIEQLRMKARSLKRQQGLDLLVIDYLQLLAVDRRTENRVVAMSEISRSLKVLAKELDIPIIALSQLNRACEGRPDKRPLLSDLRETGAIEQDADLVICIYRDEVYHEESPDRGTAELLIRKNRNGPIGDIRVAWHAQQTKFMDIN